MKIERIQESPKFAPITITIKIETEEELRALKALATCETSVPRTVWDILQGRIGRGEVEWRSYNFAVLTDILKKLNRML